MLHWRDTYLPDYDFLMENWEKHFPHEPRFELCAYRELGMCTEIECGDKKGKPKFTRAARHARRSRRTTCSAPSAPRRRPSSARSSSTG